MAIEVKCPACDQTLRVPQELMGKLVKCPACAKQFLSAEKAASAAAGFHEPPSGEPGFDDAPAETWGKAPATLDRHAAVAVVRPPAICLLITGILFALGGLGYAGYGIFMLTIFDQLLEEVERKFKEAERPNQVRPAAQPDRETARQFLKWTAYGYIGYGVLSVLLASIISWGSVSMMQLRSRGMAITASIVAMIPVSFPCCILGLGFGIWALIVLVRTDVAAMFQSASPP